MFPASNEPSVFSDLAERVKATWDDEPHRVYQAASAEFTAELDDRAKLGTAIADARRSRSLTQSDLSKLMGIQKSEISRIERGVGNPTTTTLLWLTEAPGQQLTLVPGR